MKPLAGTLCTACLTEGYKCQASAYDEFSVAKCVFCLDDEKCPHRGSPRVSDFVQVDPDDPDAPLVQKAGKKLMRKAHGELCACGCGKRLRPDSPWKFIRGHKQDKGGLQNENAAPKTVLSKATVDALCAKIDADIADLQRVRELVAKYAEGL